MKKISFSARLDNFFDFIVPCLTVIILVFLAVCCRPDLIADPNLFESIPESYVFTFFLCGALGGTFFCFGLRCFLELLYFLARLVDLIFKKKKDTSEEVQE